MPERWEPEHFRQFVRRLFDRRIEIFAGSGDDWRFAASLKAISEDTAQEYEGRAVLELIQNAHDALRGVGLGAVAIVLDLLVEPGVLYVANAGSPFTERNFKAISELALSDKVAGQGIGNKGIGFRSVLQLTDVPEIYSRNPDSHSAEAYDGFCFRFATPEDIDELVTDPALAKRVKDEVSSLALPVPARPLDPRLAAFAAGGFSTVVRLPLRDEYAMAEAARQIRALDDNARPLLLFLDRLRRVTTAIETPDGVEEQVLTRDVTRVDGEAARPVDMQRVVLEPGGVYLLAEETPPADEFRQAIQVSVERREIDKGWLDYSGAATVAAAVRVDQALAGGWFYTYLPMGSDARSPACAHLHAPFFTKLARLAKSEDIALNSFLLDVLADLCVRFGDALRDVVERPMAGVVLDLIAWRAPDHQRIVDAAVRSGRSIEHIPFVPLENTKRWGTLAGSRLWVPDQENTVFTASAVVRGGIELVDTKLLESHREGFEEFHSAVLGTSPRPSPDELADWAEAVAQEAPPHKTMDAWGRFYDDLKRSFPNGGQALRGKRVVLDAKGELQPALGGSATRRRALFFSPSPDEVAEGATVRPGETPALHRRIVFTHPDIPWLISGTPPRRRPGRLFLEESGLVREYRSDRVLDALRDLLRDKASDALRRDALHFVLKLYPSLTEHQQASLGELGLSVPLERGGWAPAPDSILAPAWGSAAATIVGRLLTCLDDEEAVSYIDRRLVASPAEWPFPVEDVDAFRDFLLSIGVEDGLPPRQALSAMGERTGFNLAASRLAREMDLPDELAASWQADLSVKWTVGNHPNTHYSLNSPLSVPAIAPTDEELSSNAREALAELLVAGLKKWPDHFFTVLVYRRGRAVGQQDRHDWPTPLQSFLRHHAWLPVDTGTAGARMLEFRTPTETWVSQTGEAPTFVPALPAPLREAVGHEAAMKRLQSLGLRVWENPSDASQLLRYLAEMLQRGEVAEHFYVNFEKHYRRAWADVMRPGLVPVDLTGAPVAVRRGRLLQAVPLPNEERIFVVDEENAATELLLEQMGRPVLVADPRHGPAAALRLEATGCPVTLTSAVQVDVYCDDTLVVADTSTPRLVSPENTWIAVLVALVAELRGGVVRRSERGLRQFLDRIQALRLVRGRELHFVLDDDRASVPHLKAVGVDDESAPTIVLEEQASFIEELETGANAIAQLIGQPTLGQHLELAFIKLGRQMRNGESPSDDGVLASALSASRERVTELRQELLGSVHQLLVNVRAAIAALVDVEAAAALDAACVGAMDEAGILAAIAEVTPGLPISAKDLVECARPPVSLDALRDDLGIDFKKFNQALVALGPPYTPRRYPERHDRVFATFVDGKREVILNRLRETFLDAARAGSVPDEYLNARELEGLELDPAWVDEYAEPPEHVMAAQVQMWLAQVGAGTDLDDPGPLEPLEFVRAENFQRLQRAVARAEKVILTWCHSHQVTAPQAWTSAQVVARTNLERSGLADFEAIAEDRLFPMLTALGWPDGMPQTIDLGTLGLSEEELQSREELEAAARQRAQQRAKTIRLNGRDVPVTVDDYAAIAAAAVKALSEAFVKQTGKAKLSPIDPPVRKERDRRRRTVVARDPGMTEDQAGAIGLVGEVFAKAWLEYRYPTAQVEWRSGYRTIVMGDDQGSDSLGYDFEVIRKGSTLMYEVKATAGEVHGDILQFSLSESELDQAQANARNDRYRLLLVLGVLVQGETTVFELPNPRAPASRGLFAVVGSGLTYNCAPGR